MSDSWLSGDRAARECRGATRAMRISCGSATHALRGPRYLAGATTLLMLLGGVSSLHAETIYVNADSGDDGWTGLCESFDGDLCGPKKRTSLVARVDGRHAMHSISCASIRRFVRDRTATRLDFIEKGACPDDWRRSK
jgi:hypothetical protein